MISRLLLLLSVSFGTSALYGMGSTELQFIDGAELGKHYVYDEIPKAFGEKVVVGIPLEASFVYCEPYESLKDQVRKHFEGVASIREMTTNSQLKESKYDNQSYRQLVAQEQDKLSAAGFRNDRYSELQIVFPKYNIIGEGNQSSSLTMRLVNGHDIFGTPSSILTLIRLDDTFARLRTFHLGIPLPKKAHSEIRIVTDTEIKMIQELERFIQKISVEVILTKTNGDPYASFDSLLRFRRSLDSCK